MRHVMVLWYWPSACGDVSTTCEIIDGEGLGHDTAASSKRDMRDQSCASGRRRPVNVPRMGGDSAGCTYDISARGAAMGGRAPYKH